MTSAHPPRGSLTDTCRAVIADLATQTSTPTVEDVLTATRRHVGRRDTIPAQVRTQVVAGIAATYFRLYAPGHGWTFAGPQHSVSGQAVDLIWIHENGTLIADVVLADQHPSRATRDAAARRLRERTNPVHEEHAHLRVLVPRAPELSCLVRSRSAMGSLQANRTPTAATRGRPPL